MNADNGHFAFDQCRLYPLPANRVLVRNPRSGRHAVLTPDVCHALDDCREFRTLDGHAEHLCAANPALAGQQASVRQVLESVRRDGLLISADVYAQLLGPSGRQVALEDRPVVAVITWERPQALARCLDSLAQNCDLGAVSRVLVIDDSDSEDVITANRSTARNLASLAPVPVHYVGAREQADFIARMVRQSPVLEEAIRTLVCRQRWAGHWTSGLARTVALLLSVGERLLVLDDDIVCAVYEYGRGEPGARFGDQVRAADFFTTNEAWEGTRARQGADPLARHARILGLGLADVLSALGVPRTAPGDFAHARVDHLERLSGESPVLLSECGSLGDPGTEASSWLTTLEGESLQRLLRNDETVHNALKHRNCWMGRHVPHIAERGNMSQLTGLDNRRLLPPYFPVMRGEDRLFANMLAFLHPRAVTVDQAWSIAHLPIPPRRWTEADAEYGIETAFPNFFLDDLADRPIETTQADPLKRLGLVAGRVEEYAAMDHRQAVERFQDRRLEHMAQAYCHLKSLAERTTEAPAAWRAYLERGLAKLNRALVDSPDRPELRGYPGSLHDERLTAWWQDSWSRFAHALRAWPAVRQAARHCAKDLPSA